MRKKVILLLIIILTAVLMTGCWDSVAINDRDYLFAVGIDKKDDVFKFTAEIPKINEGNEEERIVFSEESSNFSNFFNKSYLRTNKVISDRLMQVIIIGESVAKDEEAVKRIFDEIQRSPQMNRRVKIVIAKGKAEDIINTEIPSNPIVGRFLSEMLVKLKRNGHQDIYTFDEAILSLETYGNGMIPLVESCNDSLKISSAAVMKDYKLLGFLNEDNVEIIMLLLNPTTSNLRNISVDVNESTVSLAAVDVSMTKKVNLNDEKLTVDYYITLYSYIDSYTVGNHNLQNQEFLNDIRKAALDHVCGITDDTIYKLQKIYNADLLNIKDDLYKFHKMQYEKIKDEYDRIFSEAQINVHYNVRLKSTGLVK